MARVNVDGEAAPRKRRSIPPKLRFEILKRDEFKCRYCGRTEADGVKLHVDHVISVALGGRNDPDNLATACADCNLGKSAAMLNDPRLIGVDFEVRKKIFEDAHASLDRYREYLEAKERWEYELVSELIRPFERVFANVEWWDVGEADVVWRFDARAGIRRQELPDEFKDESCQVTIIDANADGEARVRRSVLYFFKQLGPDLVREAATLAAAKYSLDAELDPQRAFRYFCGCCHRAIRERGPHAN